MAKFVYTIFIGVLLATFVGVGIAAFYAPPKPLEPPRLVTPPNPSGSSSPQPIQGQNDFMAQQQSYQKATEEYNRNVSIISVVASIVLLALSLTLLKGMMAEGFMLGGLLTLVYSIFRGFSSNDAQFRFIVVTVGLAIALYLGYLKFSKQN